MMRHYPSLGFVLLSGCVLALQGCGAADNRYVLKDTHAPVAEEVVGALQRELAVRNYYQGAMDGVAGEKTAEAIFLFQMDCEIPLTGSINLETLEKLNIDSPAWLSE